MQFCPSCDNFLSVKRVGKSKDKAKQKKILVCSSCGYEESYDDQKHKSSYVLPQKIERSGKDKTAVLLASTKGHLITEEDRESNEWLFESSEE